MSNVWDWIHSSVLGQPDANVEARKFLDQKAAENAAAVNPNASPPNAPPPMGAAQPGPGEPATQQTPKSWGSLLLDLQQQQQGEQQFSRSLGGMLSTLAQPRNQESVRHSFETTQMDPLAFGKTAMDLGIQQQGLDRTNQIAKIVNDPVQGPALAQKMGIDWGMLKTGILTDPGMIGKIAETLGTPTPGQRDLKAARDAIAIDVKAAHPDWTPEQVQAEVARQAPGSSLLGGIGGYNLDDQAYRAYAASETAAGRVPLSPIAWKEHTKDIQGQQDEAVQKWPALSARIDETNTVIDRIKSNPKLDAALTFLTTTGGSGADLAAKYGRMDPQTYQAIQDIQLLSGQVYSEGFNASGTKRTQAEVSAIVSGLSQLKATGMSASDYVEKVLKPLQDHMQRARDIGRQAAGLPATEAPKTDSGGGGKSLSDADRKQAQDLIAKDGRESVISHLKANGYDTSGL